MHIAETQLLRTHACAHAFITLLMTHADKHSTVDDRRMTEKGVRHYKILVYIMLQGLQYGGDYKHNHFNPRRRVENVNTERELCTHRDQSPSLTAADACSCVLGRIGD